VQFWAPDDEWKTRLKHVERLTEINKSRKVASCWLSSENERSVWKKWHKPRPTKNQYVICFTYVDDRKSCPNWRFIPHRTVLRIASLHLSAHSYAAVFDLCIFHVIAIYPNIETVFGFVRYFLISPEQDLGTAHQSSGSADFKNKYICTLAPLLLLCGVVVWSVTHIHFSDRRKNLY